MRLRALLPTLTIASASCGTQEWSFYDDVAVGHADAGPSVDARAMDASDSAGKAAGDGSFADAHPEGCVDDDDCASRNLYCDPSSGTCVACVSSSQCPETRPLCDPTLRSCVQCDVTTDCGEGEACEADSHTCVPSCMGGFTCPQSAPICMNPRQICGGCRTDQDCTTIVFGPACDTQKGECVPECSNNRACSEPRPICDTRIGRCVRCVSNSDCPQGDVCTVSMSMRACVPSRDQ
jgi:hypothetical protein